MKKNCQKNILSFLLEQHTKAEEIETFNLHIFILAVSFPVYSVKVVMGKLKQGARNGERLL